MPVKTIKKLKFAVKICSGRNDLIAGAVKKLETLCGESPDSSILSQQRC